MSVLDVLSALAGTVEALASCPASPQTPGWPGTEACRNAANMGDVLLAQDTKGELEAWGGGGQTNMRAGLSVRVRMGQ